MNYKDAYLILANQNDYCFMELLKLLDSDYCDIYIHMDKKEKNLDIKKIKKYIKFSDIYFIDRKKCNWGSYSLVDAELRLLKKSINKKYRYYHLISSQDLPIKSSDDIYNFFSNQNGAQFIDIYSENFNHYDRVCYSYPLQELLGRRAANTFWGVIISKTIVKIQKILNIRRNNNILFQKGAQWFSITNDFAMYVVNNEKSINKIFKNTFCPDELFLQTLLVNSVFKTKKYSSKFNVTVKSIKRLIDWNRGTPYVWKKEDYNELINSDALFARKFDSEQDREIIDLICKHVKDGK